MSDVIPLRIKDISPEMVLQAVAKELPTIKDIYVCIINNEGTPVMYASGDLGSLCTASIALQDLAFKFLNGELTEQR